MTFRFPHEIAALKTKRFYKLRDGTFAYLHGIIDMAPATTPGEVWGVDITFLANGIRVLSDAREFADEITGESDPWWGANQMAEDVREHMLSAHIASLPKPK